MVRWRFVLSEDDNAGQCAEKLMRKILVVVGAFLALMIGAIYLAKLLHPTTPTFSDADLRPARVELPASSNAFPLLIEAGGLLTTTEAERPLLARLANGDFWDDEQAQEFLRENATALTTLNAALARPNFQVDAITNFDAKFPYMEEWRQLTRLLLVEARSSFRNGDEALAFTKVLGIIRFGHRVEGSGGNTLHYLTGAAIKSRALGCLRQFTDVTKLPANHLLQMAKQLETYEADQNMLRESLKVEYLTQATFFDEFPNGTTIVSNARPTAVSRFAYDATKSKMELAEQIRRTMAAVTNYYATGIQEMPKERTKRSAFWLIFRGNVGGTLLNEMTLPSRRALLARKCQENVALRATRVVLALRAFHMNQGRNPQSLAELLPDYLGAIPLDDFDGEPLRYSPARKVIYSIGPDLTDDGGVESTNEMKTGDIVFPFNF